MTFRALEARRDTDFPDYQLPEELDLRREP